MDRTENDLLLSFILPVYNVEEYLRECVDSILKQITPECEIILVDDGSTDSSGKICDVYAARNERIKVIHKANGGLSSARNAGISAANGRYITFVDSDDRIISGSAAKLLAWIRSSNADLCFLQADKLFPDGSKVNLGENIESKYLHDQCREEAVAYLASRPKYPGSAWAKLYRREFLLDNQLHFPYDRRFSEDLGFIRDCILHGQSFDAVSAPFYEYRQNRKGSITNRITEKNFYDLLRFIVESAELLTQERKPKDQVCGHVLSFVAYEYFVLLYLYQHIPEEAKAEALRQLKEYRWTLQYASSLKCRAVSVSCRVFGIKGTAFLLDQYRKLSAK